MSTKELVLKEIENLPDIDLEQLLHYLQSRRHPSNPSPPIATENKDAEVFWNAYLESENEYNEVYQRLANA
jgi:hypothetical protein